MLYFSTTHLFPHPLNELNSKSYLLRGGTAIPSDADMDTYTKIGNYYCQSNTTAASLSNAPFANAFTLKVEYPTGIGGFVAQTFREFNTGLKAYRCSTSNASEWGGYYYFSDDATVIKSNFEIFTTESYVGDCNGITEPGLFNQVINPDAVNGPGQYAYIVVYSASHFGMITQIALPYNIDGTLKVRTREAGTWQDWRTP